MVRKCRGLAEITVMEVAQVGVRPRTRARGLAMEATDTTTVKRRKLDNGELRISSSYIQLRSRRVATRNSASPSDTTLDHQAAMEDQRHSLSSDHDRGLSVSCCSSNGSSEKANDRIKFVDLADDSAEVETSTHYSCRDRRETTPSSELREESDGMDSTTKASDAEPHRKSSAEKMPTEAELEEFFSAAEKKLQQQFTEKYNYDIVKDKPLEGRYEWIRLKP